MSDEEPKTPTNIDEFNQVAGIIFGELYRRFPIAWDVQMERITDRMGLPNVHAGLESGFQAKAMVIFTLRWLRDEGLIRSSTNMALNDVVLTMKGRELLAKPIFNGEDAGTKLADPNASRSSIATIVGDLIGSATGALIKSVSGG